MIASFDDNFVIMHSGKTNSLGWWAYGQSYPNLVKDLVLVVGHLWIFTFEHLSFIGHIIVLNSIFSLVGSAYVYALLYLEKLFLVPFSFFCDLSSFLICFFVEFLWFSIVLSNSNASLSTGTNFLFSKSSSGFFFWESGCSFYNNSLLTPDFYIFSSSYFSLSCFFLINNSAMKRFM
jgi:hypothetical protein